MELTANKFLCIQKLQSKGIKVPESYLVKKNELDRFEIDFSKKYIIKSNKLHASSGISLLNLVDNKQDFLTVAKGLTELTKDDILVQKFIEGEEYTAVIWGSNKNPEVLPILKLNFANKKLPNIYTENAKFIDGQEYANRTYEILDKSESIYSKIEESVISTYKAFEMEDYARLDVRVNNNEVYVIDYNSNPYINSLYEGDEDCEVYICAKILGYNFGETILKICEYAYMRTKNN
jgi:D-alanine-D-alanine ligase-like ATP-grasp enzyme